MTIFRGCKVANQRRPQGSAFPDSPTKNLSLADCFRLPPEFLIIRSIGQKGSGNQPIPADFSPIARSMSRMTVLRLLR